MRKPSWNPLSPPGWRVIMVGLAFGLAVGAFYSQDSLDKATAMGLSSFIAITVGAWIGIKADLGLRSLLAVIYSALDRRLSVLEGRVDTILGKQAASQEAMSRRKGRLLNRFHKLSLYVWPIGLVLALVSSIFTLLSYASGLGVPPYGPLLIAVGGGLTIFALMGLTSSELMMWIRLARLESAIDKVERQK